MTPDTDAQPGEVSPADGPGPRELLRYRSAQGRWVVAAMILGSSVVGIDSTVVVVALPAIGRSLHVGFQALQWTVTSYTLTLASLILLAGSQRPVGAAAGVPGRAELVHPGVGAVRGRARHRMAHRRASRARYRRRADDLGQPDDHRGDPPARRPYPRDRDMGRIQRGAGPASARSARSARQRSPAPRCSLQPSSPGRAAAPRHDGWRSFKRRCPTSPAQSPSATHRDKPAPNSSQTSNPSCATDTPSPSRPRIDHAQAEA
jgi:hypothetical protein